MHSFAPRTRRAGWSAVAAVALISAACSGTVPAEPPATGAPTTTVVSPTTQLEGAPIAPTNAVARNQLGFEFPPAPEFPTGAVDPALVDELDQFFRGLADNVDARAIERIGMSGDARIGWLMSDLLRFLQPSPARDAASTAFENLTGVTLSDDPVAARSTWQSVTDHLIAWDLPAAPGYVEWKSALFLLVEARWEPFFTDPDSDIDYRLLSWGGVLIDDRPLGDALPCARGCIPALDDPSVTDAAGGDWYPDDAIVFAIEVNGEARAYPKNIMEIHEMINDTIGGRRVGFPYCTLCGSAQVYFTDSVPAGVEVPILRTSGLLTRSNKVMYDLVTSSVFDTFTGVAVSGPLREAGIALEQGTVVTTTWGEWKQAHPDTTVVAEDGGINRTYALDPLAGRDDNGPIFPVGDVDERLPIQAQVLGVEAPTGEFIAFPVEAAEAALAAGDSVQLLGVRVLADGGGVRAELEDGSAVVSHQSFWFAWSQFHPETLVWSPPLG